MPKPKSPINPFYILLIAAGIAFAITACAYGALTVRGIQGTTESGGVMALLDKHGMVLLFIEIAVLAVLTVAAIGTDSYWIRRGQAETRANQPVVPPPSDSMPPSQPSVPRTPS